MIRYRILSVSLGCLLAIGGIAIAQPPKRNVNPGRHPNLAAAQRMSQNAYEKVTAAQQAMSGTCRVMRKKAKELLEQVNKELKPAAESANKNR